LLAVPLLPQTVNAVTFRIDRAQGYFTGLAEIEILGTRASSSENVAPAISMGPVPDRTSIHVGETVSLSVSAYDLDGDTLVFEWSTDAGRIDGAGGSAVFTPPAVQATTVATVTVRVRDGRGGSSQNVCFVTIVP